MARYEAIARCFVDGDLVEPGDVIQTCADPPEGLRPLDADAERAVAVASALRMLEKWQADGQVIIRALRSALR